MSGRYNSIHTGLSGVDFSGKSEEDIRALYMSALNAGIHGLCFSAYEEGQEPGDILTDAQIRRRLEIMRPHTDWVRSFSCIEGNELIPKIAKELGFKTLVGAWLGPDLDLNEQELEGLYKLVEEGCVDIAAVGNEVLYRNDLSKEQLIGYIQRVKERIPSTPVGYVDAYYEFTVHPDISDLCDVILANCYPYWEGCPIEHSFVYMKQMYFQAIDAAKGKPVIISETGWPSDGGSLKGAAASSVNFMKYFINAQNWAAQDNIPIFYFSSFDESWKVGGEGDVGAHWGIWDKHERLKWG